ncbi:MAG: TerD family protein [Jatrophihabitans sp.]|nr:MAG: TerD family protein [Jatrophihabitans sp.]
MQRGENVEFTREVPNATRVAVGVAWNAGNETALADNLVTAAILCDVHNRALSEGHFVFFNQLASPELSVRDLDRALGQDQDQIEIDLPAVPPEVERVVVVLYVNDGPAQRRTLRQLRSCVVRLLDAASNTELLRSQDLVPELQNETALALAEVYRRGTGWRFKVLGQGYANGVAGVLADYGLSV